MTVSASFGLTSSLVVFSSNFAIYFSGKIITVFVINLSCLAV